MSLSEDFKNKKDEITSGIEDKKNEIVSDITETKNEISAKIDRGVQKTVSFTKRLLWISLIAAILGTGAWLFWSNLTYSDGTRTGYLMKVSKKGYVIKTMEGEMNMGGFQESDNSTLMGNTWYFSISDPKIYDELIQKQGKKLMLYYKEKNRAMPWQGDSDYFIYKIQEL